MSKFKKITSLVISLFPFNKIKIFLYNNILGYNISYQSNIGFFNLICCENCIIKNGIIGNFNYIDTKELFLDESAKITSMNKICNMHSVVMNRGSHINRRNHVIGFEYNENSKLIMGDNSLFTVSHHIDCTSTVTLGYDVVFGGNCSQIWTHGFDVYRNMIVKDITIGNNVYIGSASFVLGGVRITDKVSIGAGTIVSKSITTPGFYVSSELIKKK